MLDLSDKKIIFIDTEFTGEHAHTTLVSLGVVTLDGQKLYVTLNDYDVTQVSDWLKENVLSLIDESSSIDSPTAYAQLYRFLKEYAQGQKLYLISAGLAQDLVLFMELFKYGRPGSKQFHALYDLPDFLSHYAFYDLNTLFMACGVLPSADRGAFVGRTPDCESGRHNALYDSEVVRECFLKLMEYPAGKVFFDGLEGK